MLWIQSLSISFLTLIKFLNTESQPKWLKLGQQLNNGIGGTNPIVNALAMNGTNQLFVGGSFTSVDGAVISTHLANNIASSDGNSWNILGSTSTNNGVNGIVQALAMNGTNNLFVGGNFTSTFNGICSPYVSLFGRKEINKPIYFWCTIFSNRKSVI